MGVKIEIADAYFHINKNISIRLTKLMAMRPQYPSMWLDL